jgi:membrane protease subunit (stomatin/prohibitin family)
MSHLKKNEKFEWICVKCSYINCESNSICEVCANLRYNANLREQTKKKEWICIKCTFMNDNTCNKCDICGYKKIELDENLIQSFEEPMKCHIFSSSHQRRSLDSYQRKTRVNKELKNKIKSLTYLPSQSWKCIKCSSLNSYKIESCSFCVFKNVFKIPNFQNSFQNPKTQSDNCLFDKHWPCKKCSHLNYSSHCVNCMNTNDDDNAKIKPVNENYYLKCTYIINKTSISIKIVGSWKCKCGYENQETDMCEVCGKKIS